MKIYLAGGMGSLSFEEQSTWRKVVTDSLINNYNGQRNLIINPVNFYNFESVEYKTQREVMEFDLYQVRTSDLIIVNFNDEKSIGTAMELMLAKELHIPIIGLNEKNTKLHPWLVECCTRICDSMTELLCHVGDFYLNN